MPGAECTATARSASARPLEEREQRGIVEVAGRVEHRGDRDRDRALATARCDLVDRIGRRLQRDHGDGLQALGCVAARPCRSTSRCTSGRRRARSRRRRRSRPDRSARRTAPARRCPRRPCRAGAGRGRAAPASHAAAMAESMGTPQPGPSWVGYSLPSISATQRSPDCPADSQPGMARGELGPAQRVLVHVGIGVDDGHDAAPLCPA